ncbi:MAG: hypothetical protein J2P57_09195, partial [Acidimicrobiaceae bacterium]|nr:hypothetical protein [Acidimicrobiaceae bacterium]
PRDQSVLRLDETLAAWPDVRWNLDPKADSAVAGLVGAVRQAGALDRVCVTSFSDRRLRWVRKALGPGLCAAMGTAAVAALRASSYAPSAAMLRATFSAYGAVQVPLRWKGVQLVDERFLSAAHRAGLALHVWTIDDESVMRRLLALGVDGIMSDAPTVLRAVLSERGEWPSAKDATPQGDA